MDARERQKLVDTLGSDDAVEAMLADDRITAIGLFLEAVRDAQHFAGVAERAAEQGVPIVALQTAKNALSLLANLPARG